MRHLTYLAVLAGCLCCALLLEPLLRVNVLRRWRRLALTLVPVAVVFTAWDIAAIRAGHWSYDPARLVGLTLPGRLPVEELLFFLAVPACSVLGFEAVRAVRGYPAGDEPPRRPAAAGVAPDAMIAESVTGDRATLDGATPDGATPDGAADGADRRL